MMHAHCMLDNEGHKHTLRMCNTLCLSTAVMVARTRLKVTLYAYCMSYFVCGTRYLAVGEVCQQGAGENVWV